MLVFQSLKTGSKWKCQMIHYKELPTLEVNRDKSFPSLRLASRLRLKQWTHVISIRTFPSVLYFCSCCFLLLSSFNLVPAVVQVVQLVPVTGSVDWSTVSSSPHAKVSLDKTLNPKSISVCECWLKPSGTDRSAAWMCVTGYMRHVAESAVSRQDLCKYDIIYKQPTLFIFTFFHFHCVFILPGCMP